MDVCAAVSCAQGADCVAKDHRGYCKCQDGFTGNPDDRRGCSSTRTDECRDDAQGPYSNDVCAEGG